MKAAICSFLFIALMMGLFIGFLALVPESKVPDKEYICTATIEKIRCTGEWSYYNIELTFANGRVMLVDQGALEQIKIGKSYDIFNNGMRSSFVIYYTFEEK